MLQGRSRRRLPVRQDRANSSLWRNAGTHRGTGLSPRTRGSDDPRLPLVGTQGSIAEHRSALIGTDHVVIPLAADLFSLQGLHNLGPTLRAWRTEWRKRLDNWPKPSFALLAGSMAPLGYILMQHSQRLSRPVKAYRKWVDRIPTTYTQSIVGLKAVPPDADANCLARLKHYRSLVPMAMEARKRIFHLTAADGAIGSHAYAVRDAWSDFNLLAQHILRRVGESADKDG
jgi:chromosome partitioning protein